MEKENKAEVAEKKAAAVAEAKKKEAEVAEKEAKAEVVEVEAKAEAKAKEEMGEEEEEKAKAEAEGKQAKAKEEVGEEEEEKAKAAKAKEEAEAEAEAEEEFGGVEILFTPPVMEHRFTALQHVAPIWRALRAFGDGGFDVPVHTRREKLSGRRVMWFSPLDDPALDSGSFYGTVAFSAPFAELVEWYKEQVVPAGCEARFYFVERGNSHITEETVEDPYIYLLTWKDEGALFGQAIDLDDRNMLIRREGEEFVWRKESDKDHRVPYAFFDLAIEFPENKAHLPLDRLPFHRCCPKKKTKVKEFQADLPGLTEQLAEGCLATGLAMSRYRPRVVAGPGSRRPRDETRPLFNQGINKTLQQKHYDSDEDRSLRNLDEFLEFALVELRIPEADRDRLRATLHGDWSSQDRAAWDSITILALITYCSHFPDFRVDIPFPTRPGMTLVFRLLVQRWTKLKRSMENAAQQ